MSSKKMGGREETLPPENRKRKENTSMKTPLGGLSRGCAVGLSGDLSPASAPLPLRTLCLYISTSAPPKSEGTLNVRETICG